MSRVKSVLCALCFLALAPFAASAQQDTHSHQTGRGHTSHGNGNGYGHSRDRGAPPAAVPELDPNAAGQSLALLAGAAFLITQRRRIVA